MDYEWSPPYMLALQCFQQDSHKKLLFTQFPSLSGGCSALASVIGSEAGSPDPSHSRRVCVCVWISLVFLKE